jgi:hypothetical protein
VLILDLEVSGTLPEPFGFTHRPGGLAVRHLPGPADELPGALGQLCPAAAAALGIEEEHSG